MSVVEQGSADVRGIDPDIEDLLRCAFKGRLPSYETLAEAFLKSESEAREAKQLAVRQANELRKASR